MYMHTYICTLLTRKFYKFFFIREPSKSEKEAYEVACAKLKVAHRLLGQSYCLLVLGLGLENVHHMACGG